MGIVTLPLCKITDEYMLWINGIPCIKYEQSKENKEGVAST
jgi:hypothetical protein